MQLRAFNQAGLQQAPEILARVRSGELTEIPAIFLQSDEYSDEVGLEMPKLKTNEVKTRWQLGLWLYKTLEGRLPERTLLGSAGMWTWLAFAFFDIVCPVQPGGRKVADDARYILSKGDYRKSYRHLISGPFYMIRAHNDSPGVVKGILATAPSAPGEIYEQLASRKQIVTSRAAMYTATKLYLDETGDLRKGAAGTGPGSARRLADLFMQYDVTFDLYAMDDERLFEMLPKEYGRFVRASVGNKVDLNVDGSVGMKVDSSSDALTPEIHLSPIP